MLMYLGIVSMCWKLSVHCFNFASFSFSVVDPFSDFNLEAASLLVGLSFRSRTQSFENSFKRIVLFITQQWKHNVICVKLVLVFRG